MGENSNEVVKIAAGLGITLLIVMLAFGLYRFFSSKVGSIENQLGAELDSAAEATYTQYNGETVTGSTVSNFIKDREGKGDGVIIEVITTANGGSTTLYVYDANYNEYSTTDETALVRASKTKTSTAYINPTGKFDCSITSDSSVGLQKITFTQQ